MPQLICIVALVGLVLAAWPGEGRAETPVERHGRLSVRGSRIVDQHGEPVALRGMSLFWSQWMGQFYNADAVRWLRDDWNCTVVRAAMGVHQGGYKQHPEREFEKVKVVIEAAIDLGIYVIVDWHAHEPEPELAGEFFAKIAEAFGDQPNIIYETWNEPLVEHGWNEVVKPYHEAVIPKIRAFDPDNLIICGTPSWSQDVEKAAADPLRFENVAYTLHFYAATHKQWLRDKAKRALSSGVALMVTECGTTESTGGGAIDAEEMRRWWDFMDEHKLSWCVWSIADKKESSAALEPGASGSGGWPMEMLTPSGKMVREELRAKNPGIGAKPAH